MISQKTSDRICRHMNDDHAITVYAMALSTLSPNERNKYKVTNANLDTISFTGYNISFTLCSGDLCERRVREISFDPPLKEEKEARVRLIEDHRKAFTPHFTWLVTDSFTCLVFVVCIALGMFTYLADDEVKQNVGYFSKVVEMSWYFAIIAHLIEAIIVGYLCKTKLKLSFGITFKWFVLGTCVGWPITSKVFDFVNKDKEFKAKGEKTE